VEFRQTGHSVVTIILLNGCQWQTRDPPKADEYVYAYRINTSENVILMLIETQNLFGNVSWEFTTYVYHNYCSAWYIYSDM